MHNGETIHFRVCHSGLVIQNCFALPGVREPRLLILGILIILLNISTHVGGPTTRVGSLLPTCSRGAPTRVRELPNACEQNSQQGVEIKGK